MTGGGYDIGATVPGSVASALLENGLIPDPYYGDNEEKIQEIFEHDYAFSRSFALTREDLASGPVILRCDGLDTVCRITVNDREVAQTDSMHRQYRFDISGVVRLGENTVSMVFRSPVEYKKTLTSPMGPAFASMRKAQCMFGWDWGISLPDSGIWKDIGIELVGDGRIVDAEVRQTHGEEGVSLRVHVTAEHCGPDARVRTVVRDPDGAQIFCETAAAAEQTVAETVISTPCLWWPAGYGGQPLYEVEVSLLRGDKVVDRLSRSIGLRTVSLYRGEGGQGDYQISVNGTPIFVKGANIVIEDAVISRSVPERWERMVRDALRSNYNALRVWGGAYYPPDCFYELCDRAGLLVYQDFMFACRFFWPSDEFLATVREEVTQQVTRIRNHPCLALWCGNNEADFFYTTCVSEDPETVALRELLNLKKLDEESSRKMQWLYGRTFLEMIPPVVAELCPEVPYVHSSPSVGDRLGCLSMFDYFDKGDSHYYHHVNEDAPYQKLSRFRIRFLSEFGFQSYPSLKTLREYLPAEALAPYSREMLIHQKSVRGNETIELYLSRDFFVPRDFRAYVFMSQMMAGEILRYTAEYMRRDRDYSRGLLLWQHNDCWPVVSWAGVDYRGRWKGQQYYAKRFFAPVLASARIEGTRGEIVLVNDRTYPVAGTLRWALYQGREVLRAGEAELELPPACASAAVTLEVPEGDERSRCALCYTFLQEGEVLTRGSMLPVEQREYAFEWPTLRIRAERAGDACRLEITSDCYVKSLYLDCAEADLDYSDNFFDLAPNVPYTVTVRACEGGTLTAETLRSMELISVNDVACAAEAEGSTVIWEE
ncbi:MAG: glycoside hydrolase family 2 TIM barrel-domain containing protein [Oscillospiraceae bacterium]|nr:glycoside hydrolase family 2 TIM barrel-domain containing protein [Oscillospiraceae bacterium]